jgi:methylase of polypeptide subunit release factors
MRPSGRSHVRDMPAEVRLHHEAVLHRLGLQRWTAFDADAVARAHEAHMRLQMQPASYQIDDVRIDCPHGVYHPSAASSSIFVLRHTQDIAVGRSPSILEVGVGSGAVLLSLARRRGRGRYVGVDISSVAVATAQRNARSNGIDADIRESDLFAALDRERFDAIVFNPPLYDRQPRNDLEAQMLCDPGGRTLQRFVRGVCAHLAPGGAAYVATSNIGQTAPLDDPNVRISMKGAEFYDSGVIRCLVRVEPHQPPPGDQAGEGEA